MQDGGASIIVKALAAGLLALVVLAVVAGGHTWPDTDHTAHAALANGDVNADDAIDALDVVFVLQYSAGLIDSLPNGLIGRCLADVSSPWNHVDSIDAEVILQAVAGLLSPSQLRSGCR